MPDSYSSIPLGTKSAAADMGPLRQNATMRQDASDRVFGCMIGSALGDTIGLYTEFMPKRQCKDTYKSRRFRLEDPSTPLFPDSHRDRFERCAWTDDTDQALLILLSYLHLEPSKPLSAIPQEFATRIKSWISQGLRALDRPPCGIGAMVGSVVARKDYLQDPVKTATWRWIKTARHGAPNGSLMRTHPIGLIGVNLAEEEAFKLAADVGRTTHVDPRCVVACCISVGIIRGILRGEISTEEDVDQAVERAYGWVFAQPELMNPGLDPALTQPEITRMLDRHEFERHVYAKTFQELDLESSREMGYVYKCLGSAVLALRLGIRAAPKGQKPTAAVFEDIITNLIMEGGDADTNGAAAGALLGTWVGYANLPSHWTNGLAHKDWFMGKITRLTIAAGITEGEVSPEDDEAIDGAKGFLTDEELERRDAEVLATLRQKDRERKEKEEREKWTGFLGWFRS